MDMFSKVALVFPGVGSQHTMMVKSFYDHAKIARETFEEASDVLHLDMQGLCFSQEKRKELDQTDLSQLSLFTSSMAVFRVFQQEIGITPDYCLGHSLGEYSALCASNAFSFSAGLQLVKHRSEIIREVLTSCDGTMMWVINLDCQVVEQVCEEFSNGSERVYVSAYDTHSQCSISGHNALIRTVAQELEQRGAIVYPLKMSGPFHSPLMAQAAEKMSVFLKTYSFQELRYPVIANHNAQPYTGKESIVKNLSNQLMSPIRWRESIRHLVEAQTKMAFEIGPKDVLKFLIKKNTSSIIPYSFNEYNLIEDIKSKWLITSDQALSVVGRCLRAAVTTKNYNTDPDAYQVGVVRPYQEIEALYERMESTEEHPSLGDIQRAIDRVDMILTMKQVSADVKQKQMEQILAGKLLRL